MRIKPPDDTAPLLNRGAAYYNKGNYDRAIDDYTAVLRIEPDNHEALYNRGIAHYLKGDYDLAIEDYKAVLQIDPNNASAKQWIEFVRKAKAKAKK
ncbi:hypothetical protein R83H12_02397 [Fibrobacteria bacterium R8-3-H12]